MEGEKARSGKAPRLAELHLTVYAGTHEVICADPSLHNVTDAEAFPGLIRQTHRKVKAASADGAYYTTLCHDKMRRKKIRALIPPRARAGYRAAMYRIKQLFGGHLTLRD